MNRTELASAGFLLLLGLGIGYETAAVHVLAGQDTLGPRLFPAIVATGLILLGLATLWQAVRRRPVPALQAKTSPHDHPGDWPTLAWVVAGLALAVAFFHWIGFVLAGWIAFSLTTRGFSGRWNWRHVLIGLVVVLVAYVGFTHGLGLPLPAGDLWLDLWKRK
jgi:putative tricarboxylic transport membrane protein